MHIRVSHFGLPATLKKNKPKNGVTKKGNKKGTPSLPLATTTVIIDAAGNEVEVEETGVEGPSAAAVAEKKSDLEVDVSRYIETLTEWLTLEEDLFSRARIVSDIPKGAKVERPRPFSCPEAPNGCTYTATHKAYVLRHVSNVHKQQKQVEDVELIEAIISID